MGLILYSFYNRQQILCFFNCKQTNSDNKHSQIPWHISHMEISYNEGGKKSYLASWSEINKNTNSLWKVGNWGDQSIPFMPNAMWK